MSTTSKAKAEGTARSAALLIGARWFRFQWAAPGSSTGRLVSGSAFGADDFDFGRDKVADD